MADWSLLPIDLLEQIIDCVETYIDIVHFRSICSWWRLAAPRPNHCSHLVFKSSLPFFSGNSRFNGHKHCKLKRIPVSFFRYRTPFGANCLIVGMSRSESGKPKLLSPLNDVRFPYGIVLKDPTTQTIFLGYHYEISFYSDTSPNRYENWRENKDERVAFLQLDGRDFAVVTTVSGFLMMYRSRDKKWTEIKGRFQGLQDVVSFKGKFYVVDKSGKGHVLVIDPWLKVREIRSVVRFGPNRLRRKGKPFDQCLLERLVVSGDELLLVQQFTSRAHGDENKDTWFSLFKLEEKGQWRWISVSDLEDRVVFLGIEWNLCYPAKELPGMKGNCVVFIEPNNEESIRVFDFITRKTSEAFTECRSFVGGAFGKIENLGFPADQVVTWQV